MTRTCPACQTALVELDRSGVRIDACPACRGVWLDRGELDKLIQAESAANDDFMREMTGAARDTRAGSDDRYRDRDAPRDVPRARYDDDDDDDRYGKRRKRKSLLSEFLDFD